MCGPRPRRAESGREHRLGGPAGARVRADRQGRPKPQPPRNFLCARPVGRCAPRAAERVRGGKAFEPRARIRGAEGQISRPGAVRRVRGLERERRKPPGRPRRRCEGFGVQRGEDEVSDPPGEFWRAFGAAQFEFGVAGRGPAAFVPEQVPAQAAAPGRGGSVAGAPQDSPAATATTRSGYALTGATVHQP